MVKQISLDAWQTQHLEELLKKGANIVTKTGTPIILYRQTLEEEEDSYEEIVCSLTDRHVVEQVVISGGGIPPTFRQQMIYSLEEFPQRLIRKSKDLFLQTIELLEEQMN
ncbi:MAG: hypothetical protein EB150_02400 [Nitrososphaeria archaeon]|nr:hypothetical protein [Nitrososphaeria archaeon]NDB50834.1 hypothetical protein [Nitrosopumilaceae archaeon]NDB88513.1 hypothetical protein [Nitrososphaerota archaeon]NDB46003.1 hypothetical protein [Nitrososphaeria archaeon]NDB62827.1 hypothetical protein [Nitrosopumilaceae archaeon]